MYWIARFADEKEMPIWLDSFRQDGAFLVKRDCDGRFISCSDASPLSVGSGVGLLLWPFRVYLTQLGSVDVETQLLINRRFDKMKTKTRAEAATCVKNILYF